MIHMSTKLILVLHLLVGIQVLKLMQQRRKWRGGREANNYMCLETKVKVKNSRQK